MIVGVVYSNIRIIGNKNSTFKKVPAWQKAGRFSTGAEVHQPRTFLDLLKHHQGAV